MSNIQVEEKLWFEIQQPMLLWMSRHPEGRKLLRLDQTLERVDIIRPSSVSMYLGEGKYRTDFRTASKWANLIRYQWKEFQAIADEYAFLMNVGQVPFISEPVVPMAATTSTFYPAAGQVSPVDGDVYRSSAGNWASLRDGAGSTGQPTSTSLLWQIQSSSGVNWLYLSRIVILFDTSAIGSDVVSSATLSIKGKAKANALTGNSWALNIYSSTPASNSDVVAADFVEFGTTAFSSDITYASFSASAYNDFVLNATGIAAVATGGVSKFGVREATYDVADVEPSHTASKSTYMQSASADTAGTASDPKLVVEHAVPFLPKLIVF